MVNTASRAASVVGSASFFRLALGFCLVVVCTVPGRATETQQTRPAARLSVSAPEPGFEIGANDFRISDMGTQDDDARFAGQSPAIAYNSVDNEYLVVWSGDDDTGTLVDGEREIFGQRLDAATGAEVGPNDFRISDMGADGSTLYGAHAPAVAFNPTANEYLVVWVGDDDVPPLVEGELEIFGQRLDGAGDELGANDFRISDMGTDGDTGFAAGEPDVVYNAITDEYLVVWEGDDATAPMVDDETEIFAQRIDAANGAEVGPNDLRVSDVGFDGDAFAKAWTPAVTYNPSVNEYLVAWEGTRRPAGGGIRSEVYIQRIDGTTGAEAGTNDEVISQWWSFNALPHWRSQYPDVLYNDALDEYFVTWLGVVDNPGCGGCPPDWSGIVSQRLTGDTAAQIGLDDAPVLRGSSAPRVTQNAGGEEYLVVSSGSAQRVRAVTGSKIGSPLGVVDAGCGSGSFVAGYTPVDDEYLVAWDALSDCPQFGQFPWEIFGQRIAGSPGVYVLDGFGAVHAGGGVPTPTNRTPYWPGFDIARDFELRSEGYVVLDGFGGLHAGEGAGIQQTTPYLGFDIARDLEFVRGSVDSYVVLDGFGVVHAAHALNTYPGAPFFGIDAGEDFEQRLDWGYPRRGFYVLDAYGGVHAGGAAPELTPATPFFGFDIARDLELDGTGYYVLDGFGGIHTGGGVPSIVQDTPYFGWDVAEDLELTAAGYYVLDSFGGVHAGLGAPPVSPTTPYFGWDIARDLELR